MNLIIAADQSLFFLINHLPHTSLTDGLALALSGVGTAGLIWFVIAAYLFFREEKKDHWFFLPVFLAAGASWMIVELVLKPLVGRVRPDEFMGAIIVGNGADGYSFPSGHATIAFAMAVVLSRKEPRWKPWLFLLAALIAFSRIFLGKHYPLDVIAGGLLGWGIGHLSHIVCYHVSKHSNTQPHP